MYSLLHERSMLTSPRTCTSTSKHKLNVCFLLKHNIGDCMVHLDRFYLDSFVLMILDLSSIIFWRPKIICMSYPKQGAWLTLILSGHRESVPARRSRKTRKRRSRRRSLSPKCMQYETAQLRSLLISPAQLICILYYLIDGQELPWL